jgi:hypothetical protein
MPLKSWPNSRNLFDDGYLDENLVREFAPLMMSFEHSSKTRPGASIVLDLSTTLMQLTAQHMQGAAKAKYEAAALQMRQFNDRKHWFQSRRQLDTLDLVQWTIESVVGGPVTMLVQEVSFEFEGELLHAEKQWYEGGSICLYFAADPKATDPTKPSPKVYEFCRAYCDFLKRALTQVQLDGIRPEFNEHPF